jgi:hypothetical protein
VYWETRLAYRDFLGGFGLGQGEDRATMVCAQVLDKRDHAGAAVDRLQVVLHKLVNPSRLLKKSMRRSLFWVPGGGRVICSTKSHSRGN